MTCSIIDIVFFCCCCFQIVNFLKCQELTQKIHEELFETVRELSKVGAVLFFLQVDWSLL